MSGEGSSSQPNGGFRGSGSMSHVYIQHPPLRCRVPGSRGLFYDDGNKLMISPTSDQVFSWKTSTTFPEVIPESDSITEGPVLLVRYALDMKLLAIQRSNHEVQFWIKETGYTFKQRCKSESETILGFFWTDCPTCDVVFVKTSGLDFFSYDSEMKSLHLVETKKLNVSWYIYTHESRLVLLASGLQCKSFTGYQLSSVGIIRLPKFEMAMATSEDSNKPVLAAEDVQVITVYGRIYCLQVDRVAMLLHSYRFYRDAVVQQGSLPVYTSKIAASVVDNVLLVHQVDAKVVILYDLFSDSRAPISAPLPLLFRGVYSPNMSSSHSSSNYTETSEEKDAIDTEAIIYGDDWTFLVPDLICDVANGFLWKIQLDLEAISASSSEVPFVLEFLQRRKLEAKKAKELCVGIARNIILERRPLYMVTRSIDVLVTSYSYAIKTGSSLKDVKPEKPSSSGVTSVNSSNTVADESTSRGNASGKFLKHGPASEVGDDTVSNHSYSTLDSDDNSFSDRQKKNPANHVSSKVNIDTENLTKVEASNEEVHPSASQTQIIRHSNYSSNVNNSELHNSLVNSAAITSDEMYSFVFAPVEEEMAGDSFYLASVIVEFLRSSNIEKVRVHPSIYVLTIRLLAQTERFPELGLFVTNKIIEPSKEVAFQLLESGAQHCLTRKLGLDMLRQLSLHHDYVSLLLQNGYYLEALRYTRKNKVNTVRPSLFLEAAYASNDSQQLAAVLRFFSDFFPGFKNTPDHNSYCSVLAGMGSSVAA
ncbi:hypothetical protein DCAR_0310940 [Daucus carota subsp. sativus]|uniref:Mic1 domain-containing protein n=1 Tax=Daucus carota subsp. sativus TaxID=79200 RepID=A0AAF0WPB8_DAUCS|nr:PREDICTED: uncharacterized protein C18orf8 [Daucus carota subsp. sativus]WOG91690.1 hypothetical protein DCAR_0310940 [Daucus carota subsp. sativus]